MRIIDSETHPLNPAGVAAAMPMEVEWRYPLLPKALPEAQPGIRAAIAADDYEDHSAALLAEMDRHGVEKSCIMRGAFPAPNAQLAALSAAHPDRFIPFAGWDAEMPLANPPRESAKALAALETALADPACRGAGEFELGRFSALPPGDAWQGYVPDLELCRKYKAPIMFHMCYDSGPNPTCYKNPLILEPMIEQFPDVAILIAHMGRQDVSFFEAALMMARKFHNVYLTTSTARMAFIERAVAEIGAERIIFGTDWSMQHGVLGKRKGYDIHQLNIDTVRNADITESQKAMIFAENLAALLNV